MANRAKKVILPVVGFAPVLPARAHVLVLGTLPSVASLAHRQYYAHPRNAFWPIMAELLGFDASLAYAQRVAQLRRHGIALWDVCHSAQRNGSLDGAIRTQGLVANNIAGLLALQPSIRSVFLNGVSAAALFRRWVAPTLAPELASLPRWTLPSTSPANATMTMQQKSREWSKVRRYLQDVEQ